MDGWAYSLSFSLAVLYPAMSLSPLPIRKINARHRDKTAKMMMPILMIAITFIFCLKQVGWECRWSSYSSCSSRLCSDWLWPCSKSWRWPSAPSVHQSARRHRGMMWIGMMLIEESTIEGFVCKVSLCLIFVYIIQMVDFYWWWRESIGLELFGIYIGQAGWGHPTS